MDDQAQIQRFRATSSEKTGDRTVPGANVAGDRNVTTPTVGSGNVLG